MHTAAYDAADGLANRLATAHPARRPYHRAAMTSDPAAPVAQRVGLIGFGAIGRDLAALIDDGTAGDSALVGVLVRDPGRYAAEAGIRFVTSVGELCQSHPDVVVEAAGGQALRTYGPDVVAAGVDLLLVSVGALGDDGFRAALVDGAASSGARVLVPSGAIAGLDAIASAAVLGLDRVRHTVRKPPIALLDDDEAQAVVDAGEPRELYVGPAREAAIRFPANVNVVAAVSLAGIGFDRTEARVIADPNVERNTHEVEAEGAFGRLYVRMENIPGSNPKTGRIVAPSLARALRDRSAAFVVGA